MRNVVRKSQFYDVKKNNKKEEIAEEKTPTRLFLCYRVNYRFIKLTAMIYKNSKSFYKATGRLQD